MNSFEGATLSSFGPNTAERRDTFFEIERSCKTCNWTGMLPDKILNITMKFGSNMIGPSSVCSHHLKQFSWKPFSNQQPVTRKLVIRGENRLDECFEVVQCFVVPSGNLLHNYGKSPLIVIFPLNCDFPVRYVRNYERVFPLIGRKPDLSWDIS